MNRTFKLATVAGLGLFALFGSSLVATGAPVVLVSDGTSDYVIVRPEASSASQKYAAEELQRFVEQMTGARLPIQTDADALPAKAILLGNTRYTRSAVGRDIDWEGLGDDGFLLKTASPHLVIAGSDVRGTLYGVYELLETYGGCRWYASWHSAIPKATSLTVPEVEDRQVPAFVMREPFWFDMFTGDFAARCRANGNRMDLSEKHGGKIRFGAGLFVHTFYRLMPPSEFFADHPEYFSEIDGKRVADHAQLCLTNPDVVRICTERLLEKIRQDPTAKLFSLSQNDWRGYCTCENCRAIDEREGSPSGTLIHFVNQVAAEVEKEFPDVWIETLAYQYTRHPPKTIRPRHNVVPRLCTIECDFAKPLDVSTYEQNQTFVDDIRGWSAITDKLYIWDYTTNFGHYIGPHPNFGCLQGNAQFFRNNSVVGLFEQGAYQGRHAEFAELRAWVLAKLLWNPEQDVNALYDDFFPGYYGPAAPFVRQYFDRLQALVASGDYVLRIWAPMTSPWYTDEFFDQAADLWNRAEEAVRDQPDFLYNVRMGAMPVLYAKLQRWPDKVQADYNWKDGKLVPGDVPPEYAALAADLLGRIREGGNVRVSENLQRHNAFLTHLAGCTEGFSPLWFEGGGLKAAAAPMLGGRICFLGTPDGPNVLDPNNGGIDVISTTGQFLEDNRAQYNVASAEPNAVTMGYTVRRTNHTAITASLADSALTMSVTTTSQRVAPQTVRPVIRAALNLGSAAALCWSADEGATWKTVTVPGDQPFAMGTVTPADLQSRDLRLASPVTGRAIDIDLPEGGIDRVQLLCDPRNDSVRAFILLAARELGANENTAWQASFAPVADQQGLPDVEVPAAHSADRVLVEDCFLPIGRRGTWGDTVSDPKASDGSAAKLYGTHYEWCVQWRFDPAWFEPDAAYLLRARIRVEPSGEPGEAFWAGIYDTAQRKGYGQIAVDVADAGDEYKWYDVATWIPQKDQYIWIGPGRFDKKGGKPSAVKAVYIDALELIKADQAQ